MANRLQERAASAARLPSNPIPEDNNFTKPIVSQDVFRRFLKNIDYEYLRKHFHVVKEKFKIGNRRTVLANPISNISVQKPQGMVKLKKPNLSRPPKSLRGLSIFVAKTLLSGAAVYASIYFGVWGTAEETSELASKITSRFHKDGKPLNLDAVRTELTEKYNKAVRLVMQEIQNLPASVEHVYKKSASFVQSRLKKDD